MEATIASTGIVLVDLQPSFLEMVFNGVELRKRCSLLMESAALTGMRIYLTEQVPEKLGGFDEDLTALAPTAPRFAKSTFSAFGAEGFVDALRADGIEHLLLAGLETTICVYQTALDAQRSGLGVTVLTDCVSCRRPTDGEWALNFLLSAGCRTLPVETVFYALIGTAKNSLFRDFSKLVQKFGS